MCKVLHIKREPIFTNGVWEDNTIDKKFYKKMGFEKVREHGFRMGDEIQTDYIFRKFLQY